ncbi:MAG TPA: hypothetical protein VFT46_04020 [Holophagaceae bacterium]|nr:hypothetical protein [Holophagaceae bacterium]
MLRSDGRQVTLKQDRFHLDRVWKREPEPGTVQYYFGWRTSVAQALRLLEPDTDFTLTDIGMWGDLGWIDLKRVPSLQTVGEALDWLLSHPDHHSDLVNFDCRIAGEFDLCSHDDAEVTLQGPAGELIERWAGALFLSRGFEATMMLNLMQENLGKCIAIEAPSQILGIYETLDECNEAHPEK